MKIITKNRFILQKIGHYFGSFSIKLLYFKMCDILHIMLYFVLLQPARPHDRMLILQVYPLKSLPAARLTYCRSCNILCGEPETQITICK